MLLRRLHRLFGHRRRRLGESGEDTARVKPANAVAGKEPLPIDLPGLELAGRRQASVRAANCAADAEAAFDEVETVSHTAPDSVVLDPSHVGLVDTALVDEILREPADGIVRERRDHGSIETKGTLEAPG